MPVQKNERAIVVLSEVNQHAGDFRWLYDFAENAGRWVIQNTLGDDYGEFVKLYDGSATSSQLVNSLRALGGKPVIKEIDLIVMLHGHTNRLAFHEGRVHMSDLQNEIRSLNLARKLRLVYSTACFGASDRDEFIAAGFTTAIGAIGVNTTGATEVPAFVQLWQHGVQADAALAVADNQLTRNASDAAARLHAQINNLSWKDDTINSRKLISGDPNVTINSHV